MDINIPSAGTTKQLQVIGKIYINGFEQTYTAPVDKEDISYDIDPASTTWIEVNVQDFSDSSNGTRIDITCPANTSSTSRNASVNVTWNKHRTISNINVIQEGGSEIYYTITLTSSPAQGTTGMGVITLNDSSELSKSFLKDSVIPIKAEDGVGYTFSSWSDGEPAEHNITVTETKTITATYNINYYVITVNSESPEEYGTVSKSTEEDIPYLGSVTITATPNEGYSFVAWKKGTTVVSTAASFLVENVTADAEYTAVFDIKEYELTLDSDPLGAGTFTGAGLYEYKAEATFKAIPATGYGFIKWNDDNIDNPRTITMPHSDVTYTAKFSLDAHTITIAKDGEGTVTPTVGEHTYEYGDEVTLSATPATHYTFDKWSDGLAATHDITVTEDKTYTAYFKKETYTITTDKVGEGTVSEGGTVEYGGSITIEATPNSGYSFVGWKKDSESSYVSGAGAEYTVTNIAAHAKYTAYFLKIPSITITNVEMQ